MQDRHRQLGKIHLRRTAGPYIGVTFDVSSARRSLPQLPWKLTIACTAISNAVGQIRNLRVGYASLKPALRKPSNTRVPGRI